MATSKLVKANEKIADTVVGGYKKIEEGVVGAYKKIEDGFVDKFLTHEGESVEDDRVGEIFSPLSHHRTCRSAYGGST